MRTTTLGRTGPEVGVIGLGCMGMTYRYDMQTPRDDATSIAVIRQALDLGVTLIDTADVYGPYTNEELVGRALAGGHRQRAVLATKVGLIDSGPAEGGDHASSVISNNGRPDHIRTSIDDSLRRLGTDYVDLYQLHRVDPQAPLEETWGAIAGVGAGPGPVRGAHPRDQDPEVPGGERRRGRRRAERGGPGRARRLARARGRPLLISWRFGNSVSTMRCRWPWASSVLSGGTGTSRQGQPVGERGEPDREATGSLQEYSPSAQSRPTRLAHDDTLNRALLSQECAGAARHPGVPGTRLMTNDITHITKETRR